MKRLKKFESFDEPLYRKVPTPEIKRSFQSRGAKKEHFTSVELEEIKKFIDSVGGIVYPHNYELCINRYDPMREIRVTKGSDDWFYMSIGLVWFECDGFEGLMKCLKDI